MYRRLYQGLLHTVAAGHIVMAYRQRQPAYVKQAAVILKQLPQTARVLAMQVCRSGGRALPEATA